MCDPVARAALCPHALKRELPARQPEPVAAAPLAPGSQQGVEVGLRGLNSRALLGCTSGFIVYSIHPA